MVGDRNRHRVTPVDEGRLSSASQERALRRALSYLARAETLTEDPRVTYQVRQARQLLLACAPQRDSGTNGE